MPSSPPLGPQQAKPAPPPKPKSAPKPKAAPPVRGKGAPKPKDSGYQFPQPITFGPDGKPHANDPLTGKPIDGTQVGPKPTQRAETIRRQRLLVAAGFKGVLVDGIWGPHSQAAWTAYLRKRQTPGGTLSLGLGPLKPLGKADAQDIYTFKLGPQDQAGPEAAFLAQQAAEQAAAREVAAKQAAIRKTILDNAAIIRSDPSQAQRFTLRALADVLVDKETHLTPDKPAAATAIQSWLQAHGHPDMVVNGKYDQKTHDALVNAFKVETTRETNARIAAINAQLYSPAGVKPGDHVDWLPVGGGVVPTPQKLDELLQAGGFGAAMTLKAFEQHTITGQAAFDHFQNAKLLEMARKLSMGTNPLLNNPMLLNSMSREMQNFIAFLSLDSVTTLTPAGDLSALPSDPLGRMGSREWAQAQWAKNPKVIADNEKRLGRLHAQADALFKSMSVPDFQAKYAAYTAVEEQKFTNFQKTLAAHSVPWWGRAVQKVLAPGEFMRTALVLDTLQASSWYDQHIFGGTAQPRDITWEDASLVLGHKVDGSPDDGLFVKTNGALKLGFELFADPLNYARPFRAASSMLRYGTKGVQLGRYSLVATSDTAKFYERALIYEKGTWSKKAIGNSALDLLGEQLDPRATRLWKKAHQMGLAATTLKDQAMADAREKVALSINHRFAASGKLRSGIVDRFSPKSKLTRDTLIDSEIGLNNWIEGGSELKPLVQELKDKRISLYVDDARSQLSQAGASLLAKVAEQARGASVHQLATESMQAVADKLAAEGFDASVIKEATLREYDRIVQGAGSYVEGVSEAGLKTSGDKAVMDEVQRRVAARVDEWRDTFIPVMQNSIESHVTAFGEDLFDEAGLWTGRHGEDASSISLLARDSFDEARLTEIHNPRYGIGHTEAEFGDALEAEMRTGYGRLSWYASRGVKAGTLDPDFDLAIAQQKLRDSILGNWAKNSQDRLWYDTRTTLKVSDLYLGAQDWLTAGRAHAEAHGLDALAMPPSFKGENAIDQGLWEMSWLMGSRYKKNVPFDAFRGRRFDVPGASSAQTNALNVENAAVSAHIVRGDELRGLVAQSQWAIGRGYDEMIGKKLFEQGALWQALAHAQNRALRYTYLFLKAALNTWIFATLPLRPGWELRNVIDNAAKVMISGQRDPRLYALALAGIPGSLIRTVFDIGFGVIHQAIRFLDILFGTHAALAWEKIIEGFWGHASDVIGSIFRSHGVRVSDAFLDGARFDPYEVANRTFRPKADHDTLVALGLESEPGALKAAAEKAGKSYASFRESAFEMMGNRPENFYKRILFNSESERIEKELLAKGVDPATALLEANHGAWETVEKTLFDYSKITVIEDNFRIFFPFIQFWRKNTGFWANSIASKPWLSNTMLHLDQARQDAHKDLPRWMRRYIHVDEITDAAAVVPGLDTIVKAMLPADVMYDPVSLTSFAPFYRSYLSIVGRDKDNPNLPSDKNGWKIIGPMIDAVSQWGLGLNPMVQKPLESSGIADQHAWQTVFPQTSMAVALSRPFLHDRAAKIADWERIFTLMQGKTPSQSIADNFEYWVQTEVADQVARGEQPDVAKAKRAMEDWFLMQNTWGYFAGMYLRKASPEDIYLSKLSDDVLNAQSNGARDAIFKKLTPNQQEAYNLWRMRGYDRYAWEQYVGNLPMIEAYYRAPDWTTKEKIRADNPGIVQWIDSTWRGRPFSSKYVVNAQKYVDTERFRMALSVTNSVHPAFDVRQAAEQTFVTPELKHFWDSNNTPAEVKDHMVRAGVFEHFADLNARYFEIPATDFEARNGFLAEHPELVRHWNANNSKADDFKAVLSAANAHLREVYFDIVKQHGGGNKGFEAAAPLLKSHAFMFEDTKSAGKVDLATGTWKIGGANFSPERQHDFLAAKTSLHWFFKEYMPKVGQKAAWAWLDKTDSNQGKLVRDYIKKWGKHSQASLAYLKAEHWLKMYFGMPKDDAQTWLHGGSDGAKIVQNFFDKYAKHHFSSIQQGKDFREAKPWLDHYFSLPKAARKAWLYGHDPHAKIVLAYFKAYGKDHQQERAFLKKHPALIHGTPEQARRMEFWKQYFELTPDKRIAFVADHAADYGVFIYGMFGEQEQHDREKEYVRRAVGMGATDKQAHYLYVKPLLDFYFTLPADQRQLFARTNPELDEYLKRLHTSISGDPRLDPLIEQYFSMPENSFQRTNYLKIHPQIQEYFDKHSTPAERAIRNTVNQYFALRSTDEKHAYLVQHPEIQIYFDSRRAAKSNKQAQLGAFDTADPRLGIHHRDGDQIIEAAAVQNKRLRLGALRRLSPDDIGVERDRREPSDKEKKPAVIIKGKKRVVGAYGKHKRKLAQPT